MGKKGVMKGGASQPGVHYPFWFGGSASCCAAGVTHPLDLGEMTAEQIWRCLMVLNTDGLL